MAVRAEKEKELISMSKARPKFTLFTTVLDGEPLLSYWLEHHKRLFDHGVITLYPCRDNSLDIIRTICPGWDIVKPVHKPNYSCADADKEVMTQESKHRGWKMALNITEFATCRNLFDVIKSVSKETKCILPADAAVMVDTPRTKNDNLDPDIPLLLQKHHGLFSRDYPLWKCRHGRQLHRGMNGKYDVGRHNSHIRPQARSKLLYVSWFVWSPYRDIRERKLAVKDQLPPIDVQVKRGWQHMVDDKEQDARFKRVSAIAYDLNKNPGYKAASRQTV